MDNEIPESLTPNVDMINLPDICCQFPNHQSKKICAFCIDKKCQEKLKFICFDCIFDNHSQHKIIKINELNKILNSKLNEYNLSKDEKLIINKLNLEKKKEISNIINSLKEKIINQINEKFELFKEDIYKYFFELDEQKENKFEKIQKYEKFLNSNATPTKKKEMLELSKICSDIYTEYDGNYNKKKINIEEIENNYKKKLNNIFQKFLETFQTFSLNQTELIKNFLKNNFLIFPNFKNNIKKSFEWSNMNMMNNNTICMNNKNLMMDMNQQNINMMVPKKIVNITFKKRSAESINTENRSIDTIEQVIQQYEMISGDNNPNQIFVFNGKKLELDKTVEEYGIYNGATIFVVQKN